MTSYLGLTLCILCVGSHRCERQREGLDARLPSFLHGDHGAEFGQWEGGLQHPQSSHLISFARLLLLCLFVCFMVLL